MQAHREVQVVLEDDLDRVAHFSPQKWPQEPEVLPFFRPWLQPSERAVRVLAVQSFFVNLADSVRPAGNPRTLCFAKGLAGDLIQASRRVVPCHLVRGDVVSASLPRRTAGRATGHGHGAALRGCGAATHQDCKSNEKEGTRTTCGHGYLHVAGLCGPRRNKGRES